MAAEHINENVRYEPNENPPSLVAVGCLHRGVRRGPGEGRSGYYGEPHRRVVAISVCAGGAALAAASDIHTGGCRYGNHADSGNGHADRIRLLDGRA